MKATFTIKAPLAKFIKMGVCLLIIGTVSREVVVSWQTVVDVRWPIPEWILFALMLGIASLALSVLITRLLLLRHGYRVPYPKVLGLTYVPLLGKYVPGKVWVIVGGLWLYSKEGISKRVAGTCIALSMILGVSSGALVVITLGAVSKISIAIPLLPAFAAFGLLVAMHPKVFYPVVNLSLRILGRSEIESSLSFSVVLSLTMLKTVVWLLYGSGFFCIVRSVTEVPLDVGPQIIALFALANIAGFLALFAPAGIGVREGVLLLGLQPLVGPGPAIVITGVCRLWQTAIELLLAGVGWWALRKPVAKVEGTDNP